MFAVFVVLVYPVKMQATRDIQYAVHQAWLWRALPCLGRSSWTVVETLGAQEIHRAKFGLVQAPESVIATRYIRLALLLTFLLESNDCTSSKTF